MLDNLPLIENRFVAEIALSTAIRFPYKLIIAAIDRSRDRLARRATERERKRERALDWELIQLNGEVPSGSVVK